MDTNIEFIAIKTEKPDVFFPEQKIGHVAQLESETTCDEDTETDISNDRDIDSNNISFELNDDAYQQNNYKEEAFLLPQNMVTEDTKLTDIDSQLYIPSVNLENVNAIKTLDFTQHDASVDQTDILIDQLPLLRANMNVQHETSGNFGLVLLDAERVFPGRSGGTSEFKTQRTLGQETVVSAGLPPSETVKRNFVCTSCKKSFPREDSLKLHIRLRTCEKPFQCRHCDKAFSSQSCFAMHVASHTSTSFKCKYCGKECAAPSQLKLHIRTHTLEKPFTCNECLKSFASQSYLRIHMRTHTGEKPYNCEICKKSFGTLPELKLHIRGHLGERPLKCNFCSKPFLRPGNLKVHIRSHTGERPYGCDKCQMAFTTKSHLKDHIRIHLGQKPYLCEFCHKQYSTSTHLKLHQRSHTGERPFVCEICRKTFGRSEILKHHMKLHMRDMQRSP